ncbi:MAG: radical SAM protein [Bifidobacteriaceae bacterium]|jgi:anaerobic ribonucleoside-triphosphate reductase activating protein|nr:radical SAM protein [Bifidobacteriaceae bacterium]
MRLQVNRIAHPVTVLGPGRRLGLWTQGCQIHCPGCASIDTWDPFGGAAADTAELAGRLAVIVAEDCLTGLTITGGEPTEQAEALADLVDRLRDSLDPSAPALDILMFTGRTAGAAARVASALWAAVDVAVCGPYRPDRPSAEPLLASANQKLAVLTPLGQARLDAASASAARSLQTHVDDGEITLIGLPNPGDLPQLEAALAARGVMMQGRSWLTC